MYVSLSENVNVHFLLQNELVALQEEDHHFFTILFSYVLLNFELNRFLKVCLFFFPTLLLFCF